MRQCLICKRRNIKHYGICPDCEKMNALYRAVKYAQKQDDTEMLSFLGKLFPDMHINEP